MILADTSVWIDHLRRGDNRLRQLLLDARVLCHPFIVGELACGQITNRNEIITLLLQLPAAPIVEHEEAMAFLEEHRLFRSGLGWIDIHLLASAVLSRGSLWTLDKRLQRAAEKLTVAFSS